jgi:uncharacterized protein YggE
MKFVFLLAGVFVSALACAQTAPVAAVQPNTIFAGADGKFEATPDTAVLRLDVTSQQDTSKAAYEKVASAAEQVREVMRKNGIDPKAAQIGYYAVQPVYDWKSSRHKVIAYRVVTSVTLKLKDFSKVGALTEQLANIQETENQVLSYTLEEIDQAKRKASEDALRKAHNQAGAVAAAGGRTLGELLYASVDVSQPVIVPMMAQPSGTAARIALSQAPEPTAEFTPQGVTITAHVNALFALK